MQFSTNTLRELNVDNSKKANDKLNRSSSDAMDFWVLIKFTDSQKVITSSETRSDFWIKH